MNQAISCAAMLMALGLAQASAQPAASSPAPAQPVGAGEIFDALTRPDAASDLPRLRALRDSLAGTPDARNLNDIRARIDTLVRNAEHRQSELPPALVMSGIASRIDTAMTKLEATHPAPPVIQGLPGPPWLLPALAALSGTLAVGLAVCLSALVAQGRSTEESDDLRETLTRMRRKLDEMASGRKTRDTIGDPGEETADTLQETSAAIARLSSSAREAESVVRTSSEAAEQNLQNAVAVASRLETWLEALPKRLHAATEGAIAADDGEPEGLRFASGDSAILLPEFLSSLQEACDEMRVTTEALAQANQLAGQKLEASRQAAADRPDLGETDALANEMTNLSLGQALKLEDVIGQLLRATEGLPELGRVLTETVARLPQQIEHDGMVTETFEMARGQAEAAWAQLDHFVAQRLPDELSAMADTMTSAGIAALAAATANCANVAQVVQVAAEAAADMPAQLRGLQEAANALAHAGSAQQAVLAEATEKLARLAEILPEAGASMAASSEVLKQHAALETRRDAVSRAAIGEISAAAQSARADLAASADAVLAMPAQNDRLGALLSHGEQLLAGFQATAADEAESLKTARHEALCGVETAIAQIQKAAERLQAGAEAQELALARVRRAALTVASLAGADETFENGAVSERPAGSAQTA